MSRQNVLHKFSNSSHLPTAPFASDTSAKRSFRYCGETSTPFTQGHILDIRPLFSLVPFGALWLPPTSASSASNGSSRFHPESTLCPLLTGPLCLSCLCSSLALNLSRKISQLYFITKMPVPNEMQGKWLIAMPI